METGLPLSSVGLGRRGERHCGPRFALLPLLEPGKYLEGGLGLDLPASGAAEPYPPPRTPLPRGGARRMSRWGELGIGRTSGRAERGMACRGLCSCSSPSFRLTEDTTRVLLLAVLTVLYMVCGAAIFTVIEQPSELEAFQKWQIKIENFSQKYNLPLADLRGFLFEYEAAYRMGIRINMTRPQWDLVGSFYFVGTVFSTVGKWGKLSKHFCTFSALQFGSFTFPAQKITTVHKRRTEHVYVFPDQHQCWKVKLVWLVYLYM